jgi:hypothetical protein
VTEHLTVGRQAVARVAMGGAMAEAIATKCGGRGLHILEIAPRVVPQTAISGRDGELLYVTLQSRGAALRPKSVADPTCGGIGSLTI